MVSKTNKGDGNTSERFDPSSRGRSKSEDTESKGPFKFLVNTRREFDKVVWPDRQQLVSESVAVLLIVVAFATLIYLVDQLFGWLASQPQLFGYLSAAAIG